MLVKQNNNNDNTVTKLSVNYLIIDKRNTKKKLKMEWAKRKATHEMFTTITDHNFCKLATFALTGLFTKQRFDHICVVEIRCVLYILLFNKLTGGNWQK